MFLDISVESSEGVHALPEVAVTYTPQSGGLLRASFSPQTVRRGYYTQRALQGAKRGK